MKKLKFLFSNTLWCGFISLAFLFSIPEAQEVCSKPFLEKDFQISLEGTFINRSKSRTHINILWKHRTAPLPDTFAIHFPQGDSLYYVTNGEYRTLFSAKLKATRQMALHHLKEFIGKTPLRFDDLELLANGAFLCPTDSSQNQKISTAFSQMWYTLILDNNSTPNTLSMFGSLGAKRKIKILKWENFEGSILPAILQISGNNDCGTLWIHSAYAMENIRSEDPLLEKIKNSKSSVVLNLDNKLLPKISIVETTFPASKETRSESQTMFFGFSPSKISSSQNFSITQ